MRKRRYIRKGRWANDEVSKYYLFLGAHLDHFVSASLRRHQKIFKEMAGFIASRTPNQCRSHHQKQEKKFLRLDLIMDHLYNLAKTHPLLAQEPPFSKSDARFSSFFESYDSLPKEIIDVPF